MIDIRPLTEREDLKAVVRLQRQIWGFEDVDLIPLRLFVVASKIGGQVFGAFDGAHLIGFCMAIPGLKPGGKTYLHSHMLGVLPEYRNAHVGRALKLTQRDDALSRGINLIEWTFDPLEIKNAYLNIEKLGAIVRRYSVNQYGTSSSPLQGGLPTDRLTAEWWMNSKRVQSVLTGGRRPTFQFKMQIDVPAKIYAWKADRATRAKALEVQERNREQFIQAFTAGLSVLGYERDARGDGRFLLGSWDEALAY
jgi:predicted GNAT superfamily acetyltransferase